MEVHMPNVYYNIMSREYWVHAWLELDWHGITLSRVQLYTVGAAGCPSRYGNSVIFSHVYIVPEHDDTVPRIYCTKQYLLGIDSDVEVEDDLDDWPAE